MSQHEADSLAARLGAMLLAEQYSTARPIWYAAARVLPEDVELEDHEEDLIEWCTAVGIAFGFARMDDPRESLSTLSDRATAAAREAFRAVGPSVLERLEPEIALRLAADPDDDSGA